MPRMRGRLLAAVLLLAAAAQPGAEPAVRIGLTQNAAAVTIRSASAFTVAQHSTRTATFTNVLALDAVPAGGALKKSDLQYRVTVALDDDTDRRAAGWARASASSRAARRSRSRRAPTAARSKSSATRGRR